MKIGPRDDERDRSGGGSEAQERSADNALQQARSG